MGSCPYCDDGQIEVRKKEIRGKKVELYACSNAHWVSEDGELFELAPNATCSFRIWQNALSRYGHFLKHREIRALLSDGEIELEFKSKKKYPTSQRVAYSKKVILHPEYGVQIIFDD